VAVPLRFVIIGGGPAGNTAATTAARLGAEVTLVERDLVGGAAHLHDCIPSKAMIATAGAMGMVDRVAGMGLAGAEASLDLELLRERIQRIEKRLESNIVQLLQSQGVRMIMGSGRLKGPHEIAVETDEGVSEIEADAILVSTGSRPRVPDWAQVDGERILTTRDAYPPRELPEHLVVIGSGVTGVEFVHMFSSLGSRVTLIVSRQQVLPQKDPEVAAALEDELLRRGVQLYKGARAEGVDVTEGGVAVRCNDGRVAAGSHALLAIGSIPNSDGLGLDAAGVEVDAGGYVPVNHHCVTNVPQIAEHGMGLHTRVHRHLDYDKAASAIFTEPEIADVGLAEADAFAEGRKLRVTKVPFSASAKALINNETKGFVKILSDPATGVVLGGSIVGRQAAELISVIAVAVTNGLRVNDIVESLLVHPSLAEALADAAE
jgi:pyruvate/2-oxoglutarate dehydrogenase complex dihydrolipoamide dehydrogenase (E3) component